METKRYGFTIIGVMMFLAISSLLLIGVFAMSGSLIQGTRFTDSIRGLQSYLQRQYGETSSGVNTRTAANGCVAGVTSPGTGNCLLLGKVIVFTVNSSTVDTYTVIGTEPVTSLINATLEALLLSYAPKTVASSQDSYTIPWDAKFRAGKRTGTTPLAVNVVAILRSPASSQIGVYHFSKPIPSASSVSLTGADITAAASDATASYCVDGQDAGSHQAAIIFGRAQGSTAIDAMFDLPAIGAPC